MNKYLRLFRQKTRIILIVFITITSSVFANDNDDLNYIIITGQVINSEYGNPIVNHPVYIKSQTLTFDPDDYFKLQYTDTYGFFYDTIPTLSDYGELEVYTYDHMGIKKSEELHFRFLDYNDSNVFLVNFSIYMPLQNPKFQAQFKYVKKTGGDKFRFKFIDQTESDDILGWHWEFGDGTTSTQKDPEHLYQDFGMYRVSLSVFAKIDGYEVTSSISQYVYIPQINYYHIGGHCYNGEFPIHKGQAILYKKNENSVLIPFDTTALDEELGEYWFYQIPEGNYCVRAQPDKESEYYGKLIPTYYGDVEFWKDAMIIKLDHTYFEYHIHLLSSDGILEGIGSIAGKLIFNYIESRNGTDYNSSGATIYLLDELNRPLTYQYTDKNSSFNFDNLAMGTYWIYPEIAGFILEKEPIQLTETTPQKDIEIHIDADAVYVMFPSSENLEDNFVGPPYPNPAFNQISFEINANNSKSVNLYISDLQGRIIVSKTLNLKNGLNKNTIETSGFTPGMYVLRLEANGIQQERKIMVNR